MKNKYRSLVAVALIAGITAISAVHAQTVNVTNAVATGRNSASAVYQNFFQTAEATLTSFNTNYTFDGVTYEGATGYKQLTGGSAYSTLDVQRDFTVKGQTFNLGGVIDFSGIGSAVSQGEAQIGWVAIQHYDTEVEVDLRGGYNAAHGQNFTNPKNGVSVTAYESTGLIEPGIFLKKKTTTNTGVKTGLTVPFYFKGKNGNNPFAYAEYFVTF